MDQHPELATAVSALKLKECQLISSTAQGIEIGFEVDQPTFLYSKSHQIRIYPQIKYWVRYPNQPQDPKNKYIFNNHIWMGKSDDIPKAGVEANFIQMDSSKGDTQWQTLFNCMKLAYQEFSTNPLDDEFYILTTQLQDEINELICGDEIKSGTFEFTDGKLEISAVDMKNEPYHIYWSNFDDDECLEDGDNSGDWWYGGTTFMGTARKLNRLAGQIHKAGNAS